MGNRNKSNQREAALRFWGWFAANAEKLRRLHANREFVAVAREVNKALDKVDPQLAWEIGPGKGEPNLLTISAEGNAALRPLAEMMIRLAPHLEGWEFYSSRPSRPAPSVIRLPESDQAFDTSGWGFAPVEQLETGRLDLVIVDNKLAESDRERALKAVSIYLDQLLGEDTVETWIGKFRVESYDEARARKTFKITELPDYLLWATHREINPLKRSTNGETKGTP